MKISSLPLWYQPFTNQCNPFSEFFCFSQQTVTHFYGSHSFTFNKSFHIYILFMLLLTFPYAEQSINLNCFTIYISILLFLTIFICYIDIVICTHWMWLYNTYVCEYLCLSFIEYNKHRGSGRLLLIDNWANYSPPHK